MRKLFQNLIEKRRSYRKYTDEKVSKEDIEKIVKAGLLAPAGKNNKHWEFIVVQKPDLLKKLSNAKPVSAEFISEASFAVIVCGDSTINPNTWIEDATVAATYMQLQSEEMGIGSCWVHMRTPTHESGIMSCEFIKSEFNIPQYLSVECVLSFGYPNETREAREYGDFNKQVHFETYE